MKSGIELQFTGLADFIIRQTEFETMFRMRTAIKNPVILVMDRILTPVQYDNIKRFYGKRKQLKAIINSAGSIQCHYALCAQADGIPVCIVDKGYLM